MMVMIIMVMEISDVNVDDDVEYVKAAATDDDDYKDNGPDDEYDDYLFNGDQGNYHQEEEDYNYGDDNDNVIVQ